MSELAEYVRGSMRTQDSDRHVADLVAADVRRDDFYVDHSVSGAHARRCSSTKHSSHFTRSTP